MIDQVVRALDELSRRDRFTGDEDLVFSNDLGEHFDDSALRRRFYAARERAGLKPIRFHDLRQLGSRADRLARSLLARPSLPPDASRAVDARDGC